MIQAETGNERATLRKAHHPIVGAIAGEEISEPGVGFTDVGNGESVPEGIIGRRVKEVDAGSWWGGQEAINEVEGE